MQASPFPLEAAFPAPSPRLAPAADDAEAAPAPVVAAPPARVAPRLVIAPPPSSWTARLLAVDAVFSPRREALRFATGLGLAALYGLSLGVRGGGAGLLAHAVGVPAAILVALGLGVPALYIALALFDAPLALPTVVSAAARSAAASGLVLAGLAPAAALFVVSSERPGAAALTALAGLVLGGVISLGRLVGELKQDLDRDAFPTRAATLAVLVGFGVFAVAVTARIWWATLPVLRGGR
jgi:membrane-associated PAP2 superfamily phosphatase